jgi:4-hydroxy-tetrahydrodipicolinate reductase
MGCLLREAAAERGHRVALELGSRDNRQGAGLTAAALAGVDVALEFTEPGAAAVNVERCLERGVDVVSGTTGWADPERLARLGALAASRGAALLVAPNFALGLLLFRRLVRGAAALAAEDELVDLWIEETHHRHKRDAPSGTALALARDVLDCLPRKQTVRAGGPQPGAPADPSELAVVSVRAGHEPGLHRVVLDSPEETIELVHRVRSRRVFALGALRAAEAIGSRTGLIELESLFAGAR